MIVLNAELDSYKRNLVNFVNVVLDTEVFVSLKLNFESPSLNFSNLPELHTYKLFITDVNDREVKQAIKTKLTEFEISVNKVLRSENWLLKSMGFTGNYREFDEALLYHFQAYEKFKEFSKIDIISTSSVDINNLLNLYFSQSAPFSKKKKTEFPDAISILAIEEYFGDTNKFIVTRDNDWHEYYEGNESTKVFKSLSEFFDHEHLKFSSDIRELKSKLTSSSNKDLILGQIKSDLYKHEEFSVNYGHNVFYFSKNDIRKLRVTDLNILKVSKMNWNGNGNDRYCHADCEVSFVVNLETGRFEKEINGEVLDIPNFEEITLSFNCIILCTIKDNCIASLTDAFGTPNEWILN